MNNLNRNYGIFSEVTGLLIPLVYSLLPTWQPNSTNNAAVHVPPAADPVPNPNPNANNNPQNVELNDIPAQ